MLESKREWPDEIYGDEEWPEFVRKPDALYFPPGVLYLNLSGGDSVRLGEFGESEIVPKRTEEG